MVPPKRKKPAIYDLQAFKASIALICVVLRLQNSNSFIADLHCAAGL